MSNVAYADFGNKNYGSSRMDNSKLGHVAIFRSLLNAKWAEDTAKLSLWIRLLSQARHKPKRVEFSGVSWDLREGQLVTKAGVLARKLKDSKGKEKTEKQIRDMLDFFESEGMISRTGTRHGTVITITNYSQYQANFEVTNQVANEVTIKPSDINASRGGEVTNIVTNEVKQNKKLLELEVKEQDIKIPLTPIGEDIALEILDYFNQLTNSKFQSTEPILKALNTIKAKGECYTADEIKLVMEWAVKTWTKGKDLKPQNLCRMTRFDGYLSDAIKWKNRDGINPVDCPHEELIKIWNKYVPERAIDFHEWTSRRPAYKDLEAVWNGKTNKGQWREVKHMDTCFKLISQSSLFTGLQDKGWLTLDWILTPTRWSQTYEQAKREYTERKKGIV